MSSKLEALFKNYQALPINWLFLALLFFLMITANSQQHAITIQTTSKKPLILLLQLHQLLIHKSTAVENLPKLLKRSSTHKLAMPQLVSTKMSPQTHEKMLDKNCIISLCFNEIFFIFI